MATDSVNITEDAEMADCDGDKVVTMMDVLQEQQDFEEDANAVLGASDDKNCTYSKGYIKRQALYACLTCCTEAKTDPTKRAGVCLACSLNCHENHELIELYTKRNFKCDCGNPKFNSHPCHFTPDKTDFNEENIYNQNFSGLYCTCQRPYPDPEATTEDDMIQCIICEDWLHSAHLEAVVPANDQYSEMICKSCMEKNEFLHDYSSYAVNVETGDVDILNVNGDAKSTDNNSLCNGDNDNKTEIQISNITTTNGDTDMNEDKATDDTNNKTTESITETKQDNVESTEATADEKTDSVNQTDTMDVEKREVNNQPAENIESTEPVVKGSDKLSDTLKEQPDSKLEDKTESGQSDEATKGQAETVENESSKDDNKTEQQLLDDLNALTNANPVEKESDKTAENKSDSNVEQSEDSKKTKHEELPKESEGSPKHTTVDESEVEVPDTSQSEKDTKQKANDDKDVSVMDAIDELLQTANAEKESETTDENKISSVNEETKQSDDIEMSAGDSKVDNDMSSKTEDVPETSDKTSPNNETDDITNENESANSSKPNNDVKINSDDKTADSIEENTSKTEMNGCEDKLDKESPADISENCKEKIEHDKDSMESLEDNENDNKNEENTKEHKRKLSTDLTSVSPKKAKLECVRPKGVKRIHKGATFWPSNFRQKLCTCNECLSMYNDLKVLFLTDLEDTVFAYESLGKENAAGASQYEKGLEALSSLDRIQQINALTEYNNMRDKLLDFLKSFKDRKEIVKEEDIKAFFAGMKPRREPDGVYFCR
ncbi:unnamed protein product [Spodoptera littoralis]|uniref:UBR-type domain-containing protein n=1 Tax=Spodoptera littoralis TaxID=7109 RepID=A0A9P0IGE8_SPOLI|nr:unnamed protein product [Spodoptera littoralis]CAH1646398.1 unnamed protein product [Spodoptera littoralis]